jgi:hypothetical protein
MVFLILKRKYGNGEQSAYAQVGVRPGVTRSPAGCSPT